MNLAFPLGMWALLIAVPVIVLYIIKVRRRQVSVAYLRLWESLVLETRAYALFQKLKRWMSLLLQLLILVALVLALSDPSLQLGEQKKEHIVLLLDTSASMQVVEQEGLTAGQQRFALMMAKAKKIVEARDAEDPLMIVAVSDRIDVLCPFDRNTLRLRDALAQAKVSNRSLDVNRALSFAREVTQDKASPRIIFLSDGAAGRVARAAGEDEKVELLPIGKETENVGIVRFSARKNTSLGTDYVLAVVKNFGTQERKLRVELSLNGQIQKVLPRTLKPGQLVTEKFQLTLPEGGTLQLRLDHQGGKDVLALDDTAYAVVRPSRLRRVLLVTEKESQILPFQIAFQAMAEVIDEESAAVTLPSYEKLDADERRADVTICLGKIPSSLPKQGNLILIDTPLPAFLPAKVTGLEKKPRVWDWDREHLLNRYLNYRDLPIPPSRKLTLRTGTALVSSYEGPLVAAFDLPTRRAVYVGFDMTASMFPFRLAFPMLLRNAIAWFEISEDVLIEATYRPGQVIAPLRRLKAKTVKATYFPAAVKQETTVDVAVNDAGRFYFTDTEATGPYLFRVGATEYATSVNLFDPGESDVAPPEASGDDEEQSALEKEKRLLDRELWPLLVLLGLILWTAEWATYHRRLTE